MVNKWIVMNCKKDGGTWTRIAFITNDVLGNNNQTLHLQPSTKSRDSIFSASQPSTLSLSLSLSLCVSVSVCVFFFFERKYVCIFTTHNLQFHTKKSRLCHCAQPGRHHRFTASLYSCCIHLLYALKLRILMGYLSCKAESSIATAGSHASTSSSSRYQKEQEKEKPIKIQEFNYKDLELATNNFSETKLLGRGSHGLVYKGVLRGGRPVAIKKSSRTAQKTSISENPSEVENEIDILSKLQSPRLVNLVGFTKNDSQDRLLVVEFMSNGTLYDILHSSSRPPTWGRRIKLALQTAKAIDTLHSLNPPVIHRDIKSANVLIDRNFNARLGDFGLALRCVDDYRLRSTPPAGTMGYLDPCYVTPDNLSTKTDVFSFGILLLEIISGRKAIDMGHSPPSIVDWAIPLIRRGKLLAIYDPRIVPPKDPMVRKMLAVVAAKCVRSCRERRPSMKEVVQCLSELSKLVPHYSWNGLGNPCLMVENVGQPVQSRNVHGNSKGLLDGENERSLRNPRRVYSDLGFRSNLIDLMASPNDESKFDGEDDRLEGKFKSEKRGSSFRFEIGRLADRTNIRSLVLGDGKGRVSNLKPNTSTGESSDTLSGKDNKIAGSNSVTQPPDLVIT